MQYRVGSNCVKQRIANTRTRLLHVVKSRRGATEECLLVGEILTGKTNLIVCVAALKDNGLFGHAKKKTKGFRKQAGRMINSGLVSTGNFTWHPCSLQSQRRTAMFPWEIILRSQRMYVMFFNIEQFLHVLIQPGLFFFFKLRSNKCRASSGSIVTVLLQEKRKKVFSFSAPQ